MKNQLLAVISTIAIILAAGFTATGCKSKEQKAVETLAKEIAKDLIETKKQDMSFEEKFERFLKVANEPLDELEKMLRGAGKGTSVLLQKYDNSIELTFYSYMQNHENNCGDTGYESCKVMLIKIYTDLIKDLDALYNGKLGTGLTISDENHKKIVSYINNTIIPLFEKFQF